MMKSRSRMLPLVFVLALVAGCASTNVTQSTPIAQPGLARPNRIWVYNFIATRADMPSDSSIRNQISPSSTPPTPDQIQEGRRLGAIIAQDLVADINAMGLNVVQAGYGASPQVGDGVIRGYLVSTEGGSAVQRFVIGFGAGTSEMDTVVEGYAVTPQGWRKLGSGTLTSSGNKTPGMIVPAAVAIATANPIGLIIVGGAKIYGEARGRRGTTGRSQERAEAIAEQLEIRFQDRGWIQ